MTSIVKSQGEGSIMPVSNSVGDEGQISSSVVVGSANSESNWVENWSSAYIHRALGCKKVIQQ